MWNERNLHLSHKVRIDSNQGIPVMSIAKLKDSNPMGVQCKVSNLELHVMDDVLIEIMKKLVALHDRELPLSDGDGVLLMGLGRATADVDCGSGTMMRAAIFKKHGRQDKWGWIHGEVPPWNRHGKEAERVFFCGGVVSKALL
jgi:hypothetical protein